MLPSARGMLLMASTYLASGLHGGVANAGETPYCQQVRARAASDADLLMTPRVLVTGLRFPRGAQQLDSGPTTSEGFQLRTGLAFSPVDFYKGQTVLRVGAADCERNVAGAALDAVLARGTDDARWSALKEQGQFLRSRSNEWRELQAKARERLSQRIITVIEFTNTQRFVDALEHKLVRVEGESHQLVARRPRVSALPFSALPTAAEPAAPQSPAAQAPAALPSTPAALPSTPAALPSTPAALPSTPSPALGTLASRYLAASTHFEREVSRLRRLDDWKLQVAAGIIPQAPVEWYGALELSFSLGGLVRGSHEEQYVDARARALKEASDGVDGQLERFRSEAIAVLEQARQDLGLVQHSLDVIQSTRSLLEASEADSVAHARDMLAIEQLSIESDSVFLHALVQALESLVARARG